MLDSIRLKWERKGWKRFLLVKEIHGFIKRMDMSKVSGVGKT